MGASPLTFRGWSALLACHKMGRRVASSTRTILRRQPKPYANVAGRNKIFMSGNVSFLGDVHNRKSQLRQVEAKVLPYYLHFV